MTPKSGRSNLIVGAIAVLLAVAGSSGARADSPVVTRHAFPVAGILAIEQGSGKLVALSGAVSNVFVADPKIIAVRPASASRLFVFGKAPGLTTLTATDAKGRLVATFRVSVSPSHYPAIQVEAEAARIAPGSGLSVTSEAHGLVLRGTVPSPAQDYLIAKQARLAVGSQRKILNETEVEQPQQVALKVRIAEMSCTVTQKLGINWQSVGDGVRIGKFLLGFSTLGNLIGPASGGAPAGGTFGVQFPGQVDGILDALNTDNLAHILAEPTLTALSGQSASFIDGGSFPVPVPGQNGQVTVEYQNYGVQLKFTPVVLNDGNIVLHVKPTVSSPTTQNAFQVQVAGESIVVPSLSTQSASTTVVIGSGQTLAIAGLLSNSSNQSDHAVPGLGQIPVLGAAFHNDDYDRQEEELVILVTPYLVKPVNDAARLTTPDAAWTPPNQLQRIFLFRNNGTVARRITLPGQAGFVLR